MDKQDLFQAVYASVVHTNSLSLEKQKSDAYKKLASKYCKRQYSLKKKNVVNVELSFHLRKK